MTLHMLRLDPDMRRAAAWGAARGLTPDGADQGYLWHALLTAVFGGMAPRPWRRWPGCWWCRSSRRIT